MARGTPGNSAAERLVQKSAYSVACLWPTGRVRGIPPHLAKPLLSRSYSWNRSDTEIQEEEHGDFQTCNQTHYAANNSRSLVINRYSWAISLHLGVSAVNNPGSRMARFFGKPTLGSRCFLETLAKWINGAYAYCVGAPLGGNLADWSCCDDPPGLRGYPGHKATMTYDG
jgi:hypothetical protein